MATPQHSMKGKVCLITGANGGLGKATAASLASLGAHCVLFCRDKVKGQEALEEIKKSSGNDAVELLLGDLSSLKSIRTAVIEFQQNHQQLDVLINNAAVYKNTRHLTEDGIELMFATNHLGHFLLTHLLLPNLKACKHARIVNIAAPVSTKLEFDDLQGEKHFSSMHAFAASKACNLIFNFALAKRLQETGITVNAVHPGLVKTNITTEMNVILKLAIGVLASSPEKAAATPVYVASDPKFETATGEFIKGHSDIKPDHYVLEENTQNQLWDISMKLCGLESS